ncbi:hypothetical protein D3C86_1697420 [compost metagenome]
MYIKLTDKRWSCPKGNISMPSSTAGIIVAERRKRLRYSVLWVTLISDVVPEPLILYIEPFCTPTEKPAVNVVDK